MCDGAPQDKFSRDQRWPCPIYGASYAQTFDWWCYISKRQCRWNWRENEQERLWTVPETGSWCLCKEVLLTCIGYSKKFNSSIKKIFSGTAPTTPEVNSHQELKDRWLFQIRWRHCPALRIDFKIAFTFSCLKWGGSFSWYQIITCWALGAGNSGQHRRQLFVQQGG